ncbi:MAG: hypothetical protein M3478_04695, partial [Planctomycetota bacterium]|nr:hypothetical protein [Planctomycetota bacterium]
YEACRDNRRANVVLAGHTSGVESWRVTEVAAEYGVGVLDLACTAKDVLNKASTNNPEAVISLMEGANTLDELSEQMSKHGIHLVVRDVTGHGAVGARASLAFAHLDARGVRDLLECAASVIVEPDVQKWALSQPTVQLTKGSPTDWTRLGRHGIIWIAGLTALAWILNGVRRLLASRPD